MKFRSGFLTILLCSVSFLQCSSSSEPVVPGEPLKLTTAEKKVAASSNNFGFGIFQKINASAEGANVFISPLSISMALGMTMNGAAGLTYTEMQKTLGFQDLSDEAIKESYLSLTQSLYGCDASVKFQIANSIWNSDIATPEAGFVNDCQKYFDAGVTSLNFSDAASVAIINGWVNDKTNGKIKTIVDNIPQDALMYLINAIYFKGIWKIKFDEKLTSDTLFYKQDGYSATCKMMHTGGKFRYAGTTNYSAIELPYGSGNFRMTVILPNTTTDIDNYIKNFSQSEFDKLSAGLAEKEGDLYLPKFKLELELKLNDILASMGMPTAFTLAADFSRMYKNIDAHISEVRHKTFIEVNEEGTEAAAVTIVEMKVGATQDGGGSNRFRMHVNHPFIFVISEKSSNSVLFIGKITNPSAS